MSTNFPNGGMPTGRSAGDRQASALEGATSQVIKPLLAGAQARGMADMLELLEQGAILISVDGAVLFASERAQSLTLGAFSIISGHLAGQTVEVRSALDRLFNKIALGEVSREVIATSDRAIEVRALKPGNDGRDEGQLLHCVLAIRELRGFDC